MNTAHRRADAAEAPSSAASDVASTSSSQEKQRMIDDGKEEETDGGFRASSFRASSLDGFKLRQAPLALQPKAESRRFSGRELSTALQVQPSTPARGRRQEWASYTLTSVPLRSQDNLSATVPPSPWLLLECA